MGRSDDGGWSERMARDAELRAAKRGDWNEVDDPSLIRRYGDRGPNPFALIVGGLVARSVAKEAAATKVDNDATQASDATNTGGNMGVDDVTRTSDVTNCARDRRKFCDSFPFENKRERTTSKDSNTPLVADNDSTCKSPDKATTKKKKKFKGLRPKVILRFVGVMVLVLVAGVICLAFFI